MCIRDRSCTSHDLGQNFARAFDTKFQDEDGEEKLVWQTSWGVSTRSIGGLIVGHGDDNGLIVPPRLAPIQVVIVPVDTSDKLLEYCNLIMSKLKSAGIRVKLDAVSYTHLRAHETVLDIVCRLLLEKKTQ